MEVRVYVNPSLPSIISILYVNVTYIYIYTHTYTFHFTNPKHIGAIEYKICQ